MTEPQTFARVYRFGDTVAFHTRGPSEHPTLYLTPDLARRLGEELIRRAADIRAVKFTDSTLGTTELGYSDR